jgi:hypothetical protein
LSGAELNIVEAQKGFRGAETDSLGSRLSITETIKGLRSGTSKANGERSLGEDDYFVVNEQLRFESGETLKVFTMKVKNDEKFEFPNEKIILTLRNSSYYDGNNIYRDIRNETIQLNNRSVDVTILEDGDAGRFSFSQRYFDIIEANTTVEVAVTRQGRDFRNPDQNAKAKGGKIYINYETIDKWANSEDFNSSKGTIFFDESDHIKKVNITIKQDNSFEYPDEVFDVALINPIYNRVPIDPPPLNRQSGDIFLSKIYRLIAYLEVGDQSAHHYRLD